MTEGSCRPLTGGNPSGLAVDVPFQKIKTEIQNTHFMEFEKQIRETNLN